MRILKMAALGLVGLATVGASVAGYDYFTPATAVSAPLQAVAIGSSTTTNASAAAARRYEITAGTSQARFVIDEMLNGAPKAVVGTADQVAGQIVLDPNDADATQVGTILINARALATDSAQRDRAIQNWVLDTADHEYVRFTPTALVGLPDTLNEGQSVSFQIVGDLTIRDVTQPVTFEATVTPAASERLKGSAIASVRYAEWGISIPRVPMVASVSDELQLYVDLVASPV